MYLLHSAAETAGTPHLHAQTHTYVSRRAYMYTRTHTCTNTSFSALCCWKCGTAKLQAQTHTHMLTHTCTDAHTHTHLLHTHTPAAHTHTPAAAHSAVGTVDT